MRPFTLHPVSLLAGVVLAGVLFVSMSQKPVLLNARTVNVQYMPDPRDMVQISEGTPYQVPEGKLFVPSALGSIGINVTEAHLFVNGNEVLTASGFAGLRTVSVPSGFTAAPGSSVTVTGSFNNGRAWGYLAPQ